jgi:menaquinone-dependent protoporphyrinogen oxidase
MRVLVTAASKHGATTEIAANIGSALREAGLEVDVIPVVEVATVSGYDAIVLGSAVYAGRWLDEAKRLAERLERGPSAPPVWLFSSGPIGEPPKPEEEPPDGIAVRDMIGAREHRVFAGRLNRTRLSFLERTIVGALKAPEGDFRDWEDIRAWASDIARALQPEVASVA